MKSAKAHQEEEEEEDEEFGAKKDGPQSSNSRGDAKNTDKTNQMRSKHSVTEQRRRSKINERFQKLRDLIPHSDQKRDTASFLLEVIEYVQYLQEKVQKYEGPYQGWNVEPTKLMPWRNNHWRVQQFAGHPQSVRFDENNVSINPTIQANPLNPVDFELSRDTSGRVMDQQAEFVSQASTMALPLQPSTPAPILGDGVLSNSLQRPASEIRLTECAAPSDALNQQEGVIVEGGTISISSGYSQGLLNALTQALQSSGLDLSQATISVQIDLGKRATRSGLSIAQDHDKPHSGNQQVEVSNGEDADPAHKRLKI